MPLIGTKRALLSALSFLPFRDNFNRSNHAIESPWTGTGCTIVSNKAIITPTQGADLLAAKNGDFADWTLDNPDVWTVSGESGADPEVAEVATGEAHADAGTPGGGFCNIYTSDGTVVSLNQAILTADNWYQYQVTIDTETDAGIALNDGNVMGTYGVGTHIRTNRAKQAWFYISRAAGLGAVDVTFDNVLVKQLTLSTLFSSLVAGSQDIVADVDLVVTAKTQAGLVLCLDSAATPANFLIAYHDGTKAYLEKCVAGTYTSLISTAAAYGAGRTLQVKKSGTSVELWYHSNKIGATQTVSDAGIINNRNHGLFSTYASNTMDNFVLVKN